MSNVISTKLLIEDTFLPIFYWRRDLAFYVVIGATRSSSRLRCKGSPGNRTKTFCSQSSALPTELILLWSMIIPEFFLSVARGRGFLYRELEYNILTFNPRCPVGPGGPDGPGRPYRIRKMTVKIQRSYNTNRNHGKTYSFTCIYISWLGNYLQLAHPAHLLLVSRLVQIGPVKKHR